MRKSLGKILFSDSSNIWISILSYRQITASNASVNTHALFLLVGKWVPNAVNAVLHSAAVHSPDACNRVRQDLALYPGREAVKRDIPYPASCEIKTHQHQTEIAGELHPPFLPKATSWCDICGKTIAANQLQK